MTKKVKENQIAWGIIGVGDVCEVKSAPAMKLVSNSRIEIVMRRNEEKLKDYAHRHQIDRWTTDPEEVINDPKVNAVYIATPPNAHLKYTKMAAKAGKPVYVEKPMARTYDECQQMIDACENAGVPLYVAYYRRTLPHFLKIKQLVQDGAIGQIRTVNIKLHKATSFDQSTPIENRWRVDPKIAGGGHFYDLASHQLDFLDFLFGPIKSASGYASNQAGLYRAEDIVTGSFFFESGVHGTGSWCFTTSTVSEEDLTTIIGDKGEIAYSTFGNGELVLKTSTGEEKMTFNLPKHIQQFLIQQVVDDLLGKKVCVSTGESAARTNQVLEWLTNY